MLKNKWLKRIAVLLTLVMVLGSVPVLAENVDDGFVTFDEVEGIEELEEDLNAEDEEPAEQEEDQEEPVDPKDSEPAEDEKDTPDLEGPTVEMEEELFLDASAVVWDGSVADGFAGGSGTRANPYLIETPAQLAYLAQMVNSGTSYSGKYFEMTNDMALNGIAWTPIGTDDNPFAGSFNGNRNSIYGLYVNGSTLGQGLFGISEGIIENTMVASGSVTGWYRVGGIAGEAITVNNCVNYATVRGDGNVGGVVGLTRYGNITRCKNYGDVTGVEVSSGSAGGIVGRFWGTGQETIEECVNSGKITGLGAWGTGGIVGSTTSTVVVKDCVNVGNITGNLQTGGIVGETTDTSIIKNCYNMSNVTSTIGEAYSSGIAYGDATIVDSYYQDAAKDTLHARDLQQLMAQGTFVNWDFNNVWKIKEGETTPDLRRNPLWAGTLDLNYAGGTGIYTNPYLIQTKEQLTYLAQRVNSGQSYAGVHFKMTEDIVLNSSLNNPENWTPIGNENTPFYGNFNGNGHSIHGLYVNGTTLCQGLFGLSRGVIENITIASGEVIGWYRVGGIAGEGTTIRNCTNYASISATGNLGGIAGLIRYGNVSGCKNYGDVIGVSGYSVCAGGVIGRYWGADKETVEECFNTGKVETATNSSGGIVGSTVTTVIIENCANMGNVKSLRYAGGIVGETTGTSTVKNCYSAGDFIASAGNAYASGVAYGPTAIISSYFFDETNFSPHARTSAELKQQSTFEGWDFENVWSIEEGVSYPKLQWVEEMEPGEPTSFLWPTDSGEITLWHGQIDEQYQVFHKGMNIQGPLNSQVYSICDGIVTQISNDVTFGTIIYVECEYQGSTLQIRYGNINPVSGLTVGQQTRQGDVIGTMRQGTGEVTNKGVAQIAMLMSGDFVNPQDYLDRPETNLAYLKRPMATVLDTTGLEVSSAYTFSVTARETLSNDKNGRYVQNLDLEDGEVYLRKIVLDCAHLLDPSVNNDNLEALGILIYDPVTNTATVNLNGKTMIYGVGLRSASGTASNQNDRLIVESDAFIKYAEVFEKALWYNTYQKTETFNINAQDRVDASVSAVIGVMSIEPTSEGVRQQQIAVGGVVYATPNLDSASDYARIQDVGLQIRVSDSDKLRVFTNQSADWLAWYPEEGDLTWSAVYGIFDTAFGMVEDQTHFSKIISMVQSFFSSGKKGIDRELVEFTWDYTSLTYVHEAAHYLKFRLELDESLTLTDWYTVRYYMFYSNRLLEIDNGKNYFIITRDVDGELTTQACTEEELLERMSDEEQVEFLIQKEIDKNELYIKTFADKDEDVVEIHLEQKEYLETLLEQVPDADQGELNAIRFELDRSREEVEVQMAEIFEM